MTLAPKLLRYDQAAQLLACSKDHIMRLVELDKLERVFIGEGRRSARITAESIDRYIDELKRKNGSHIHSP